MDNENIRRKDYIPAFSEDIEFQNVFQKSIENNKHN
jgi:hypothetical protein